MFVLCLFSVCLCATRFGVLWSGVCFLACFVFFLACPVYLGVFLFFVLFLFSFSRDVLGCFVLF